jgi:Leucine-rich repeat (LRR) protein
VLDLKNNDITLDFHIIPVDSKLAFLRLSGTGLRSLEGISRATHLQDLHVTNNEIVYIPNELYDMVSLEALFLSFNGITGTIPREIGKMSNLSELYLFGNRMTGSIPSEIGRLTALVEFVAASNFLSGELPTEISELSNLEQFSVANQDGLELITGPVPSFAGAFKLWYVADAPN